MNTSCLLQSMDLVFDLVICGSCTFCIFLEKEQQKDAILSLAGGPRDFAGAAGTPTTKHSRWIGMSMSHGPWLRKPLIIVYH